MSLIIIDHDDVTPSIIDQDNVVYQLATIELDKDIVIVYMNDYIQLHKIHGFAVNNVASMLLHQGKYILPVAIFLPIGYDIQFKSLLDGIRVKHIKYNKIQEGFEIDVKTSITEDDLIVLNKTTPNYKILNGVTIFYDIFDRGMLIRNTPKKVVGDVVQPKTDVFAMNVIRTHIGIERDIRNVYFIKSHYLYNRIPDF